MGLPEGERADASTVPVAPLRWHRSLRAKGLAATLALFAYLLVSVLYVAGERSHIHDSVQALQQLARHEKALALAEATVAAALEDAEQGAARAGLAQAISDGARQIAELEEFDPAYALVQRALLRSAAAIEADAGEGARHALRNGLARAADELEIRRAGLVHAHEEVAASYEHHYDAVTAEAIALALAGVLVFGSGAAWFLGRLTGDIGRLEAHARRIVHGSRGVVLPVRRGDELGRLMHAVNRLAADLDQREKRIELDGQRRSHEEKMLAVGALAAGVAHEVNNPLTVIAGLAQDLGSSAGELPAPRVAEAAQAIIEQARRAARVSQHLAELAAPQASELDWVDVNAMLARVLQLMRYDRRYRGIAFASELDAELPAVRAPASALQQVLMQMATLGCDATCAAEGTSARVRTRRSADAVEVRLEFPAHLDFNAPEVQRTLLLCRAIIEPLGARLAFRQEGGPLLHIKLRWPAETGKA